jgi:hypothetical protein
MELRRSHIGIAYFKNWRFEKCPAGTFTRINTIHFLHQPVFWRNLLENVTCFIPNFALLTEESRTCPRVGGGLRMLLMSRSCNDACLDVKYDGMELYQFLLEV